MNCSECRAVLTELARQRSLVDADQEQTALAHAASCAECMRHKERERSLTGALAAWAAEPVPMSEDIWERLADHPLPNARPSRLWPVAVAAAAAVIAIGLAVWKPAASPTTVANLPARTPSNQPRVIPANQAAPVTPVRVLRHRRAHRPPHPTRRQPLFPESRPRSSRSHSPPRTSRPKVNWCE